MLAQLSVHWNTIAELAHRRLEPRPQITAALLDLCLRSAEGTECQSPGSPHENGSPRGDNQHPKSVENNSQETQSGDIGELAKRVGALNVRLDQVSNESAQIRSNMEEQAQQVRNLASKASEFDVRLQQTALEARERLQRQEAYYALIARVRNIVRETLPAHSTVLVVSNGDDQFVSFAGHTGWHFLRTDNGLYAGRHPTNSAEAISELDKERFRGAKYMLFPETSFWWFQNYPEFSEHLQTRYRLVLNRDDTCKIYSLRERS
jgi:hypothetical protein